MENIRQVVNVIKIVIATVGGYIANLLGGWDGILIFLQMLMVIDYILGLSVAVINKEINSKKGFVGIARKIFMFIPILMAYQADILFNTEQMLRYTTITFYIVNESISIIENLSKVGIPVPKQITKFLEQLNEENGGD